MFKLKAFLKKLLFENVVKKSLELHNPLHAPHLTVREYNHPSIVHGQAFITDGKIFVTDPKNYGSFATIQIPNDARFAAIYINGKETTGQVVVCESDVIVVKLFEQEPSVVYTTITSKDELTVSVRADIIHGMKLRLLDSGPTRQLVLSLEETQNSPEPVSCEEILGMLNDEGYNCEINYGALNRICCAKETREEIILHGNPPLPGRPGRFKWVNLPVEIDGKMRKTRLSTVSAGNTLAIYESEISGVPGKNVFGKVIPAEINSSMPILGNGVIEVNKLIVAARDGRIVFTRKRIAIVPELHIDHDFTAKDGKLDFDGNVVVNGSVLEDALIQAAGTVTVYGNVSKATIIGEKGVVVAGSVSDSSIWAGHNQLLYNSLSGLLHSLISGFERFHSEYSIMFQHAMKRFNAYMVIPNIPSVLFENRHGELGQYLISFVTEFSTQLLTIDHSYRILNELIQMRWQEKKRTGIKNEDIQFILDLLKKYQKEIEISKSEASVIKASSVSSSTMHASGNIIITGKGSFSSTLESENTISVQGNLRGGFIVTRKSAYIGELGSPFEIESSVRITDADGFVKIKLRHPNTVIEVHGRRDRCYNMEGNILFKGDGRIDQSIVS